MAVVTHCAATKHVYTPLDHVGIKQVLIFSIYSKENNTTETMGC